MSNNERGLIDAYFSSKGALGYSVYLKTSDGQDYTKTIQADSLNGYDISKRNVRSIDLEQPSILPAISLEKVGSGMFSALFGYCSLPALRLQQSTKGVIKLNLRFTDAQELSKLPWESIFDKEQNKFLCLSGSFSISRYLNSQSIPPKIFINDNCIRVLIIASGDMSLNYGREIEEITQAKISSEFRKAEVKCSVGEDFLSIRRIISEFKPNIVHFIGHGLFDVSSGNTSILLNKGGRITPDGFWYMIYDPKHLKLVVLNSCSSAENTINGIERGFAQTLIKMGVPAVIAMQDTITDSAAITFGKFFYLKLFQSLDITDAISDSRRALYLDSRKDAQWHIPVLYTRTDDTAIFHRLTSSYLLDEILSKTLFDLIVQSNDWSQLDITNEEVLLSFDLPSPKASLLKHLSSNKQEILSLVAEINASSIPKSNKEALISLFFILGDNKKVAEMLYDLASSKASTYYQSGEVSIKEKKLIREILSRSASIYSQIRDYRSSNRVYGEILKLWVSDVDRSYSGAEARFHKANTMFCEYLQEPQDGTLIRNCELLFEKSINYLRKIPNDDLFLRASLNYSSFLIYKSRLSEYGVSERFDILKDSLSIATNLLGVNIPLDKRFGLKSLLLAIYIEKHNLMLVENVGQLLLLENLNEAVAFIEAESHTINHRASQKFIYNAVTLYLIISDYKSGVQSLLYLDRAASLVERFQSLTLSQNKNQQDHLLRFRLASVYREKAKFFEGAELKRNLEKSISILLDVQEELSVEAEILAEVRYHLGVSIHRLAINESIKNEEQLTRELNRSNYYLSLSLNYYTIGADPDYFALLNNLIGYNLLLIYETDPKEKRVLQKARHHIKKAISIHPERSSFLDTMGWLEYLVGNLSTAQQFIEKSALHAKTEYELEEALDHLAKIYSRNQIPDKGKSFLLSLDTELLEAINFKGFDY